MPRRMKFVLAAAVVAAVISAAYASQSFRRLHRAAGRPVPFAACRFQVVCERTRTMGMSLPFPQVSCRVETGAVHGIFTWQPTRNTWVKA